MGSPLSCPSLISVSQDHMFCLIAFCLLLFLRMVRADVLKNPKIHLSKSSSFLKDFKKNFCFFLLFSSLIFSPETFSFSRVPVLLYRFFKSFCGGCSDVPSSSLSKILSLYLPKFLSLLLCSRSMFPSLQRIICSSLSTS